MRKKFCTFFLLLVLSVQILPIQQMGNALFSNQFAEEIPHSLDVDKSFAKKSTFTSDYLSTLPLAISSVYIDFSFEHHFMSDAIPQNHTGDIHVPPPNC